MLLTLLAILAGGNVCLGSLPKFDKPELGVLPPSLQSTASKTPAQRWSWTKWQGKKSLSGHLSKIKPVELLHPTYYRDKKVRPKKSPRTFRGQYAGAGFQHIRACENVIEVVGGQNHQAEGIWELCPKVQTPTKTVDTGTSPGISITLRREDEESCSIQQTIYPKIGSRVGPVVRLGADDAENARRLQQEAVLTSRDNDRFRWALIELQFEYKVKGTSIWETLPRKALVFGPNPKYVTRKSKIIPTDIEGDKIDPSDGKDVPVNQVPSLVLVTEEAFSRKTEYFFAQPLLFGKWILWSSANTENAGLVTCIQNAWVGIVAKKPKPDPYAFVVLKCYIKDHEAIPQYPNLARGQ